MANDDEIKKIQQRYKLEQQINKSIKENTKSINDYVDAQKQIVENYKDIQQLQKQIDDLMALGTKEAEEEAKILQAQKDNLIAINKELSKGKNLAKAVGNEFLGWGKQLASNFIPNLNSIFETFLKIDDLAHQTANTLGFQGAKLGLMKDNISISRDEFVGLGFEIEDAYKVQSALSEATGRQVMLTREASKSMAQTARITGMAVEGVAELSGQMEAFGLGAEESSKFILQMSKEASDMGLNSGKVIKSFQQNLGLLNKLNFKNGMAGLKAMTKFSEKFKLDMQSIASVADKVFRPEGAIEAAAQLQVLGGDLAALGDPFQLMYKARNAPEELAKSLTKAATASAVFNKKTGEFEVNAYELDRLKEAANALGMDYSQLVETAKQGAKIKQFEGLLGGKGLDKDTMEALTGAAQMGKEGAFVNVKGDKVFLKDMTNAQAQMFKRQEEDNAKLAEEAMSVQSDLTRIKNEIMVTLVKLFEKVEPILKSLIEGLRWMAQKLIGFLNGMTSIFGAGGTLGILLATYFGAKALYWYLNGKRLGKGFNSVASISGDSKKGFFGRMMDKVRGKTPAMPEQSTVKPETTGGTDVTKQASGMSALGSAAGTAIKVIAFAAAIYILAQALKVFNEVEWSSLVKGGIAIVGFGLALEFLEPVINSFGTSAWPGIVAMIALGGAVVLLGAGLFLMGQVPLANLIVGFLGLIGVLIAFSALSLTGVGWAGVALVLALGAAMLMIGGAIYIASLGLATLTDSFTNMFSVIGGGQLLAAGLGFMAMAAGLGILTISLIAMGAAALFALPGLLILGEVTSMLTETASALSSSGGGEGIAKAVNAINSVDESKLEALKDLSMWMALVGASPTIKFDESLTIDGSIEISGQSGGKSNTDWIKDPIFVSKLKQMIADATEADKKGGKA